MSETEDNWVGGNQEKLEAGRGGADVAVAACYFTANLLFISLFASISNSHVKAGEKSSQLTISN